LIALSPVIVVVATRWGRDYMPVQDNAVMDLRVRDVWSSDVPLTGAYSRYGWSHPGPMMYWLIAPLSLVFGKAAWATLVGAALLQGAAIVWLARLAWRAGGLATVALWLAVGALAYSALGSSAVLEAWNPHIAFPFFTLFLLQTWLVCCGDVKRLLGAVVVGSFILQTHVGYAPLVVASLGAALVFSWVDLRARGDRVRDLPVARWAVLALLVLWLPVVIEPMVHPPGNLRQLADFFVGGGSGADVVGVGDGTGLLAGEFRVPPPWFGGTTLTDSVTNAARPAGAVWLLLPAALFAWAAVQAWKRRDRAGLRTVIFVGVVMATALVALARTTGAPFPYLVYWRVTVATFTVLMSAWVVVRGLQLLQTRAGRAVWLGALSAFVVVASVGLAVDVADHPRAVAPYESVTRQFVDELTAKGEPQRRVIARFVGSALGGVHAGIVDELDRRGTPVFVDDQPPYAFGYDRAARVDDVDEFWYVVEDGHALSLLTQRPGASVLVRTTPLNEADEAEVLDLQRRLARQLTESGHEGRIEILSSTRAADELGDLPGFDPADLQRLDELNALVAARGVCRCAVISFPASADP
jgi:hypothetical protein